jgi:hypothetical protein
VEVVFFFDPGFSKIADVGLIIPGVHLIKVDTRKKKTYPGRLA